MYKIKISLLHTENADTLINTAKYEDNLLLLFPLCHDIRHDFFGGILQIETMYSNFRKGPLDLLQILATELHVVDYLKNWVYFRCNLNTYCHLHYL